MTTDQKMLEDGADIEEAHEDRRNISGSLALQEDRAKDIVKYLQAMASDSKIGGSSEMIADDSPLSHG